MKFKSIISIIVAICILFSVQCISVFAGNASEPIDDVITVNLKGTWTDSESETMTTEDNINFSFSVNLKAGSYQFDIEENGTNMSHPTTINDTTVKFTESGIELKDTVTAKCTLVATGGDYTFNYNAESDKLIVNKAGITPPEANGEKLEITAGNQVITANKGDVVKYSIFLKADKAFEDVQTALNFDSNKLSLTATDNMEADALKNCPNLKDVSYNSKFDGYVGINSSNLEGYDFTEEKVFLSLEFTVTGTGKTNIEFTAQDMTIKGGEESYYFLSTQQSAGATFREAFEKDQEIIPTVPVTPTTPTDPANPTVPTVPTVPDETEATEPDASDATESTDPTATDATIPSSSSDVDTTTDTTPSESESETTTVTTTVPDTEFELGDVNRDDKLNIRDATLIQKYLAKLSDLDDEQIALADYQTDGKVNIKDATKIQKKLANII